MDRIAPIRTPLVDKLGQVAPHWIKWFVATDKGGGHRVIWQARGRKTSTSAAYSTLFPDGAGDLTIGAGTSRSNRRFRLQLSGTISKLGAATTDIGFRVAVGSNTFTGNVTLANADYIWQLDADVTFVGSGAYVAGIVKIADTAGNIYTIGLGGSASAPDTSSYVLGATAANSAGWTIATNSATVTDSVLPL